MNLQTIKSVDGKVEYVLLPINIYNALRNQIKEQLKNTDNESDYQPFNPTDYVDNPVALARIEAGITQEKLARRMKVTQAYISKIENQEKVTLKILKKVKDALKAK
jgi:ribosome-binding protein aMBF1 (putative translation factor)